MIQLAPPQYEYMVEHTLSQEDYEDLDKRNETVADAVAKVINALAPHMLQYDNVTFRSPTNKIDVRVSWSPLHIGDPDNTLNSFICHVRAGLINRSI